MTDNNCLNCSNRELRKQLHALDDVYNKNCEYTWKLEKELTEKDKQIEELKQLIEDDKRATTLIIEKGRKLESQIEEAKELINDLVGMAYTCELNDDDFALCDKAEQFLREVEE